MRLDPTLLSALAALSLAGCASDTTPCTAGHHSGSECAFRTHGSTGSGGAASPEGTESSGAGTDTVAEQPPVGHDPCPACGRG